MWETGDLFMTTSPSEAKNMLISAALNEGIGRTEQVIRLELNVRRAYFYTKARKPLFIDLPKMWRTIQINIWEKKCCTTLGQRVP